MALTVRELRDRIANGLTTALGSAGWTESRYPPELFGMDTRDQRHLGFSVGVPATTPAQLDRQNTRGGSTTKGTVAETEVIVRWGYRLRSDGVSVDYGLSLDAEAVLVAAVLAIDRDPQLALRLVSLRRAVQTVLEEGDLVEGQIALTCLHRVPLE